MHLPIEIARCERFAEAVEADIAMSKRLPMDAETNSPALKLEIKGRTYTAENRTDAAKALEKLGFNLMGYETADTAECRIYGLPVTLRYAHMADCIQATIHAAQDYTVDFTKHAPTNLKRLESCLPSLEAKKKAALNRAASCRVDIKDAERILAEPFTKESELMQKSERLNTLREELNQAAAEAVSNDKSQKRTHYFDMARLRASSRRLAGTQSVARTKENSVIK